MISKLHGGSKVVIESSALFGRCQAVIPSWPVDRDRFIQVAVRHTNPNYRNIEGLRKDYPGFTPRIELWGEAFWLLPESSRRYAVQMPEEMVILDPSGEVHTTRPCGSNGGDCTVVPLAKPERGIAGTVRRGPPDFTVAGDLKLSWPGNHDAIFVQSGHCFWAYSQAANTESLRIEEGGSAPAYVSTRYGFYVVAVEGNSQTISKVSKEVFEKSRKCSEEVADTWPIIPGGYGWKR